mgnify:FL=1
MVGRVKVYESIVKGTPLPNPGIPEAFRVLIKEFQALGLNISVIDNNDEVVGFKELEMTDDEEEDDTPSIEEVKDNKNTPSIENELESEDSLEDEFEDVEDEEESFDEEENNEDEDYEELEEVETDFDEDFENNLDEKIGGEF